MILKLQWPISGSPEILIYDQTKKIFTTVPATKEYKKLFGNKLKIYCKARIRNKELIIDEVIKDQPW